MIKFYRCRHYSLSTQQSFFPASFPTETLHHRGHNVINSNIFYSFSADKGRPGDGNRSYWVGLPRKFFLPFCKELSHDGWSSNSYFGTMKKTTKRNEETLSCLTFLMFWTNARNCISPWTSGDMRKTFIYWNHCISVYLLKQRITANRCTIPDYLSSLWEGV